MLLETCADVAAYLMSTKFIPWFYIRHKDQEEEWHLNFQGAVDAHNILDGVIPEVILNYCTFK